MILATILLMALTRAEVIERFRADPVTKVQGLVQVVANCPADMRREFQGPVADYVAGVCRTLYESLSLKPRRFAEPGIYVHLGDSRGPETNVVARVRTRDEGGLYTRIYIVSPRSADVSALQLETIRAFHRAMGLAVPNDREARIVYRRANPVAHAEDLMAAIDDWRFRGVYADGRTDVDYLRLRRKVLLPGRVTKSDVLAFAARLRLYPDAYDAPFAGRFRECGFAEAIEVAHRDPRIRLSAFAKMTELAAYGGGRGDAMSAACAAYIEFLKELAKFDSSDETLAQLLEKAEGKLREVNG